MNEYIVQHALQNVWCSPEQDYQHLFKLCRISRPRGVMRSVAVEWAQLQLPDITNVYHVYQLGQLSPVFLKLLPTTKTWYSTSSAVNTNEITIDIYNQQGLHLPLFTSYLQRTESRNLILAVKAQPAITDLSKDTLFIRFYSNAYFASERSHPLNDRLFTKGIAVTHRNDAIAIQQEIADIRTKWSGVVYILHNGWWVDSLDISKVKVNDIIEFIHDTSIERIWSMSVENLETFISSLDGVRKYLLKQPNGSTDSIAYHDDLDFWVYNRTEASVRGIFFHKSFTNILRMVTHSSYSVAVQALIDHAQKVEGWLLTDLALRIVIRKSGYDRPLVFETNRIKELYRLNDVATMQAMLGVNAVVPEWQVANLEQSKYPALMSQRLEAITSEQVQAAYGYNALSKLVGEALHRVVNEDGRLVIYPPFKLRYNATMYEYDVQGRLIDFHYHNEGRIYGVHSPLAYYVEALVGKGGITSGTFYDTGCAHNPTNFNLRAWVSPILGGVNLGEWRNAIPVTEYVQNIEGLIWLVDHSRVATAVRNDSVFLSVHRDLAPLNGLLTFILSAMDTRGSVTEELPLLVPTGKLDLFLNGHPLIENLDYFVTWPKVVICNKEYLLPEQTTQRVTIRATNFPDTSVQRLPPNEFGFITHNYISRNNRFDVRDDRVLRYIIEGRIWTHDELSFSEDHSAVTIEGVRNGAPYLIDEIIVPMDELTNNETYAFREQARRTDTHVSDYLTLYYPETPISGPSIIERRYQVLSPFASRIHDALATGYLYPEAIKGQYSDVDIESWVHEYLWLLDFDPIIKGVDDRYVVVHPHHYFIETVLDIYQYTFLERVIRLYLQGRVDLTSHVRIKEDWI